MGRAARGRTLEIPYYPRNFIDPTNGLVFMASERIRSRWFDVDGSTGTGRGRWTIGPQHLWPFNRDYGSPLCTTLENSGRRWGRDVTWETPDAKSQCRRHGGEDQPRIHARRVQSAGSILHADPAAPERHDPAGGQVLVTVAPAAAVSST